MKEQADRRLTLNRRGLFVLVSLYGHLAVAKLPISIEWFRLFLLSMNKKILLALITLSFLSCGKTHEEMTKEKMNIFFENILSELTDNGYSISHYELGIISVIFSNDSICLLQAPFSIKANRGFDEHGFMDYALIKDMGASRIKGKPIYKEFVHNGYGKEFIRVYSSVASKYKGEIEKGYISKEFANELYEDLLNDRKTHLLDN